MDSTNARRTVVHSPICVVHDDGSITFRGKRLSVPEVFLQEVVGSGANGFVVKGHHRLLSVALAVKFWASLRTRDARNKMAQGIAEVKKLIQAERYRFVILWRNAGESAGIFYAVMDFFPGETLERWKDSHPLGLRRRVAYRLVDEVCAMAHGGLYHGDLHTRNVLMDTRAHRLLGGVEPRLGIIDFGTSLFSSREASCTRHWRVFMETVDRLVSPFELRALAGKSLPVFENAISTRAWFRVGLARIRHALIRLGAEWLIDPEETHEFHKGSWHNRESMLAEIFPVPQAALNFTERLVQNGTLSLTEKDLGSGQLWWPLDSPVLDGFSPPWRTSMSDPTWD